MRRTEGAGSGVVLSGAEWMEMGFEDPEMRVPGSGDGSFEGLGLELRETRVEPSRQRDKKHWGSPSLYGLWLECGIEPGTQPPYLPQFP